MAQLSAVPVGHRAGWAAGPGAGTGEAGTHRFELGAPGTAGAVGDLEVTGLVPFLWRSGLGEALGLWARKGQGRRCPPRAPKGQSQPCERLHRRFWL